MRSISVLGLLSIVLTVGCTGTGASPVGTPQTPSVVPSAPPPAASSSAPQPVPPDAAQAPQEAAPAPLAPPSATTADASPPAVGPTVLPGEPSTVPSK